MKLIKLNLFLIFAALIAFIPLKAKAQVVNPYNLPISIIQPKTPINAYPAIQQDWQQDQQTQNPPLNQQTNYQSYQNNQGQPIFQQANIQPYRDYRNFEHREDRRLWQQRFTQNKLRQVHYAYCQPERFQHMKFTTNLLPKKDEYINPS